MGATALGRYHQDFVDLVPGALEVLNVVNIRRPLASTPEKIHHLQDAMQLHSRLTITGMINNTNLSETERQSAVQSMVEMTELVEKESATELLLEAKGFTDVVVNLTGETADIVVPMKEVTEEQRAQIEDIVTRKTGIGVENIVITPMSSAADTAAEESAQ